MNDTATLAAVLTRLEAMQQQLDSISAQQRRQQEFVDELVLPIAKEAMRSLTTDFADLEKKGYFAFGRELLGVGQRIVESYSADDVRALGASITTILDTVKAMTQPEVLKLAGEATQLLHDVDRTEPVGLVGMVRATRNPEVGRGIAVLLELLKKVGRGAAVLEQKQATERTQREKVNALLAPKRRAAPKLLGVERAPAPPRLPAKTSAPAPKAVVLDGVAYNPDGHLADPSQWTRALAENIAAAQGVALTPQHWQMIDFARKDFGEKKASPNIRRFTQAIGVDTRLLYTLFPKAPARTIARIAGIPKPAGCL